MDKVVIGINSNSNSQFQPLYGNLSKTGLITGFFELILITVIPFVIFIGLIIAIKRKLVIVIKRKLIKKNGK